MYSAQSAIRAEHLAIDTDLTIRLYEYLRAAPPETLRSRS
jgi:hypothetical protein